MVCVQRTPAKENTATSFPPSYVTLASRLRQRAYALQQLGFLAWLPMGGEIAADLKLESGEVNDVALSLHPRGGSRRPVLDRGAARGARTGGHRTSEDSVADAHDQHGWSPLWVHAPVPGDRRHAQEPGPERQPRDH